ncbi:MAG: COG4315 family predicted lipoprotein [Streptosporangiaceae bacterium]
MRKSGWAVAAGFGSLALLLTACGSSSSPTAASTSAPQSSAASSSSAGQASTSAASSSSAPSSAPATSAPASHAAQPAASGGGPNPYPVGTTVMIVQKSKLGYVLAEANGQVVYTYAHDTKGGTPTCTGSCADIWAPVTGVPKTALGESFPGTFGLVARSDGTKQMTYNGYPLYTFKGAFPLTTHVVSGVWNVVPLSASDIT